MEDPLSTLPPDLIDFLRSGRSLIYDSEASEAGLVTLRTSGELVPMMFPVETHDDTRLRDPNYPSRFSYLVLGIDLIRHCTGYSPTGMLVWLPIEGRFGIWDPDHCSMRVFSEEVNWACIVAAPAAYINAGWTGIDAASPNMVNLEPWHAHPYSNLQQFEPQPVEADRPQD